MRFHFPLEWKGAFLSARVATGNGLCHTWHEPFSAPSGAGLNRPRLEWSSPHPGPCGFSPFAVVASLFQMLAKAHGSCSAYPSSWQLRSASDYRSQSPLGDDECLARKLLELPVLSLDSDTAVQDAYLHLTDFFQLVPMHFSSLFLS